MRTSTSCCAFSGGTLLCTILPISSRFSLLLGAQAKWCMYEPPKLKKTSSSRALASALTEMMLLCLGPPTRQRLVISQELPRLPSEDRQRHMRARTRIQTATLGGGLVPLEEGPAYQLFADLDAREPRFRLPTWPTRSRSRRHFSSNASAKRGQAQDALGLSLRGCGRPPTADVGGDP